MWGLPDPFWVVGRFLRSDITNADKQSDDQDDTASHTHRDVEDVCGIRGEGFGFVGCWKR